MTFLYPLLGVVKHNLIIGLLWKYGLAIHVDFIAQHLLVELTPGGEGADKGTEIESWFEKNVNSGGGEEAVIGTEIGMRGRSGE